HRRSKATPTCLDLGRGRNSGGSVDRSHRGGAFRQLRHRRPHKEVPQRRDRRSGRSGQARQRAKQGYHLAGPVRRRGRRSSDDGASLLLRGPGDGELARGYRSGSRTELRWRDLDRAVLMGGIMLVRALAIVLLVGGCYDFGNLHKISEEGGKDAATDGND